MPLRLPGECADGLGGTFRGVLALSHLCAFKVTIFGMDRLLLVYPEGAEGDGRGVSISKPTTETASLVQRKQGRLPHACWFRQRVVNVPRAE
mmetsp:Transcript_860/g.2543  ORF Transcript_860/g.2543 Transcript_860/m.2543 type:complete len:92 (-) Transcript_860:1732-2007(-)